LKKPEHANAPLPLPKEVVLFIGLVKS